MSRKYRITILLVVVALALFISNSTGTLAQSGLGPLSGGAAGESPSSMAAPVPGGPGYYTINAFEFMPYMSLSFPGTYPNYNIQSLYNPSTTQASWYVAPVNLPNGATITKMVVYFYDNSASYGVRGELMKCPLASEGCSMVTSTATSTGAQNLIRSMEAAAGVNQVVDLSSYSYDVEMELGPGQNVRLLGVRIDYTYNNLLPAAMRAP